MTKITNQNYPNGLNPLGYMGVNAPTPGQQVAQLNRAPTTTDAQNFTIGTQWLATVSGVQQIWELVSLSQGIATWVQLYPAGGGSGGASEFPTDSGTANEVGGVLNVLGGPNINTVGSGDTVTVGLDTTITVDGVRDTSMSDGVVISDNSGNLTSINGTDGQVLIAATGAAPAWALPTAGSNIAISGGSHTLTIGTTTNINIPGTLTVQTLGQGILYANNSNLVSSYNGTDGQVLIAQTGGLPAWNTLTAGAGIAIAGGPGTITITNTGGGGGGGITTLTANTGTPATAASIKLQGNNVIATNGASTGEIDFSLTNGSNGQVLIGGGANPAWASITAGTNITLTPGANSLTIAASGTTPAASCAFFYYQPTRANNVMGTQTFYGLGATVVMTSLYDNTGGAVTPGNGAGTPLQFTAPATGLYYLSATINTQTSTTSSVFPSAQITITGNPATANTYFAYSTADATAGSSTIIPATISGVFMMTMNDVAIFQVTRRSNLTLNVSINGSTTFTPYPGPSVNTWVLGYRVA